jgi:predicted transcriptional regulator
MFIAKLSEPRILNATVSVLSDFITEASFSFQKEGIKLIALDPANISMVVLNILPSAFLEYKVETPVDIKDFIKVVESPVVVRDDMIDKKIYGYTVIDSLKAITDLSPIDMVKLYGLTSERALIFVKSHSGRSSMIALKVTNLRPGLVVLQGSEKIDDLAKRIAELEGIPIGVTKIKNTEDLLKTLKKNF